MKKIINKNIVVTLLSLVISIVYILIVKISYKETYNEVFAFLGFFVVLIPMIFGTKWKWGFINSIVSLLLIMILMIFWWQINTTLSLGEFSFENRIRFIPVMLGGIQGIILGIILRTLYLLSKKYK